MIDARFELFLDSKKSSSCHPCLAMMPREHELVAKGGSAFAVQGIRVPLCRQTVEHRFSKFHHLLKTLVEGLFPDGRLLYRFWRFRRWLDFWFYFFRNDENGRFFNLFDCRLYELIERRQL
jgi:thiol-disulfide isomerase/thioredoxin